MRLISVMRMETPDETLALAAAGGDRAAFAALVTRHYDRIHALAWRLTGSAADAQDLTQSSLVQPQMVQIQVQREAGWRSGLHQVELAAGQIALGQHGVATGARPCECRIHALRPASGPGLRALVMLPTGMRPV